MARLHRLTIAILVLALLAAALAPLAYAEQQDPRVIDSEVLHTGSLPEAPLGGGLVLQGTSLPGDPYRYVLTLLNHTEWTVPAARVLDRYFPPDPDVAEISNEWFPRSLEPGSVASIVLSFADGAVVEGCHQLEVSVADGLGTILMDCSPPGSTTIWFVPIDPAMEAYLSQPPLTQVEAIDGSKLGIHVTSNSSPAIMEFVREAQPAVVMAVGDIGWLADVKAASPETITVARFQNEQPMEGDPVEAAQAFVAAHADAYLTHPQVDYWLGWNEPSIDSREDMAWFAEFEAERTRRMADLGLSVAIGNFSVGVPEPSEFEPFLAAVAVAQEHGGVLALHEYSAPSMRQGVGAGVPGLQLNDQYGALTLRYRIWYDHYLRAHDLVIPLIITEAGIDGGVLVKQGITMGGWRDAIDGGQEYSPAAVRSYMEQLSWYDDELRRDPYVLGFAVFNAGDPDGEWATFDVTSILQEFTDLIRSK